MPCATDDDIEREMLSRLGNGLPQAADTAVVVTSDIEVQAASPSAPRFDLLWSQFHSVEDWYSRNPIHTQIGRADSPRKESEREKGKEKEKEEEVEEKEKALLEEGELQDESVHAEGDELGNLMKEMDNRIGRVYAKAPPNTLFIILSGRGPLHTVIG